MPPARPTRHPRLLATALYAVAVLTATAARPAGALAQDAKKPQDRAPAPAPLKPHDLELDPAAAPIPALRYRFLPSSADLNPGDAAPVYLRLRLLTPDALWDELNPTLNKWRDLPPDTFPTAEARAFVNKWSRQFEQIAFAVRRKSCNWNYTVPEQRIDVINVAVGDSQVMRQFLRLLDLKARVEIAEGKHAEAVQTIGTGLAFSRHVAEGPFLINGLIGLAGVYMMLARTEELIGRPGAPNLYWALSALPSPIIDFRHEIELEEELCTNMIPELTEATSGRPRTPDEWESLLTRIHGRIVRWARDYPPLKDLAKWDLTRFKAESRTPARAYLRSSPDFDDRDVATMSDDQAIALFLARRQRELWDDLFKASGLPARDAIPQLALAASRIQAEKSGPLTLFSSMLPSLEAVMKNNLKTERHLAALRTIEAIRLHAAAHGGKLPESLDQITEVPVPRDPGTGDSFIYRAADDAAILYGTRADLPPPAVSYRLTIRH